MVEFARSASSGSTTTTKVRVTTNLVPACDARAFSQILQWSIISLVECCYWRVSECVCVCMNSYILSKCINKWTRDKSSVRQLEMPLYFVCIYCLLLLWPCPWIWEIPNSLQHERINGGVCYLNELPIHAKFMKMRAPTTIVEWSMLIKYAIVSVETEFTNAIKANPKTISTNTQIYMCVCACKMIDSTTYNNNNTNHKQQQPQQQQVVYQDCSLLFLTLLSAPP